MGHRLKTDERRLIEYDIDDIDLNEADSESISDKLADGWYDSNDAEEWLILNEAESEFDSEWEDNELWDEITPKITTKTGHVMKRKCMNIFGRKLCLCEFENWVRFGTTKHRCGRKEVMVNSQKIKEKYGKNQQLADKKNKIVKLEKKELHQKQAVIKEK